jgi:hypothetical protein
MSSGSDSSGGDYAAPRSSGGGGRAAAFDDLNDDVPFATNDPGAREPGTSKRRI